MSVTRPTTATLSPLMHPLDIWHKALARPPVYELLLPVTPSNNLIKEMHYQEYRSLRREWRNAVLAALGAKKPAAPLQCACLFVERRCSGGGLDWDNAYGGLKPLLDCLVMPTARNPDGLGLIVDDNPKNMPVPPLVSQQNASPGKGSTLVKIFDIANIQES